MKRLLPFMPRSQFSGKATHWLGLWLLVAWWNHSWAFQPHWSPSSVTHTSSADPSEDLVSTQRRSFLKNVIGVSTLAILPRPPAMAVEETSDLTSQMFNPDGSLKEGIESEAKFRTVKMSIDPTEGRVTCIDGKCAKEGSIQVSYELPLKWEDGENLYFDRSEGVNAKACNHITVYQAAGNVAISQLEKAARIGIGKALDITDDMADIQMADLIGGRTSTVDGQKYFQFDMGVAPKTCADSPDNLGLGFCPFESLYLLSGTILDDRLYVFALQCDKAEWKKQNADLRRVRSTFTVTKA